MEFHELLDRWSKQAGQAVLATVVAVEGHAYRKIGASMLIYESGQRIGGISPGCLETDLTERVNSLLSSKASQMVEYDMRNVDDFAWGEAVGCGGSVHVLLEPVTGELERILAELLLLLNNGYSKVFTRTRGVAGDMVYKIGEKTDQQGSGGSQQPEYERGDSDAAAIKSFEFICEPKPRLIILGAGADAEPIAEMAGKVGFRVVVSDWRESLCCTAQFGDCAMVAGSPKEAIDRLDVHSGDYVIVMSHQLQKDRQYLAALWPLSPRYVGLLGSEARADQLLEGRTPPAWLKWPVGLAIKAEGPMEIAVSVVAELIAVRRGAEIALGRRKSDDPDSKSNGDLFGGRRKSANGEAEANHSPRQQRRDGWIGD
ncbi:XdhC family protein [Paenibacillus agricola]|uniref:XdhC family protein n=1 Tax=Paenibacillus agricola TaxID=2716264 RepID=A0ABX0J3W0_9BACL|nr:XdhC family protein [Paenibacillus agricola]NHN31025.1 XdhC family protein [Paenibacillus agricola]